MNDEVERGPDDTRSRVERALEKFPDWGQKGRYRAIAAEVDRLLPDAQEQVHLKATLLVWQAQAHLAMGSAELALPSASDSWELEPSPHACHLASNALEALGDLDASEEMLRIGWRLFPEAVHLPVQLAVVLSDQARLPEALDILDEIPLDHRIPNDLQVFLFGLRSNLLATMGRWAEAEEALNEGIDFHPDSELLGQAHDALRQARGRSRAEKVLENSWRDSLSGLDGSAAEVDESVIRCGDVNEFSTLIVLGARRLWRAYLEQRRARPQTPDVWGVALVLAILEIDNKRQPIAPIARSIGCNPSSVRKVLARFRAFLSSLDIEFAARAFAAHTNPRLSRDPASARCDLPPAEVLRFPPE
jgi:tetratricopeptide (TPR) repeat protein